MKSVQYSFLFLIIIFLCIVLSCCASVNEYNPERYDFEHDDQFYFLKLSASLQSIAASENGYYFFSGQNNSFIYYMDKKTLKPVVLCNKPDCLHADEPDGNKRADCNAYVYRCSNLLYYDKHLYAIGADLFSDNCLLYQLSLDGTGRKVLYTFKEVVQRLIIHRGCMYYSMDDFDGNENNISTCRVYRMNIDTIGNGPELVFEGTGICGLVGYIAGYKSNIYFLFMKYTDSTLETLDSSLYQYSIEENSVKMIQQDVGCFTFHNDRIIYAGIDRSLKSCDLSGSDAETVGGIRGFPMAADNYIYIFNSDSSGSQFAVYDWEGHIVKAYDSEISGCMLYGGDERCYFLEDERNQNEYGNIHTIYMIDKSQLPVNADPIKVFEYIPNVPYSGMIVHEN